MNCGVWSAAAAVLSLMRDLTLLRDVWSATGQWSRLSGVRLCIGYRH